MLTNEGQKLLDKAYHEYFIRKEVHMGKFEQLFCGRGTGKLWMGFQLQDDGTWKRTGWDTYKWLYYRLRPDLTPKWITVEEVNKCKEAHMKKAIFILQEATEDGVEGYIVKGWENVLKRDELPEKYLDGTPYFCLIGCDYDYIAICRDDLTAIFIFEDDFYSKEQWEERYEPMLQAGHRLSKILEEQRKPKTIRVEI